MLFKKVFFSFFMFTSVLLLLFLSWEEFFFINFHYMEMYNEIFNLINFSVCMDKEVVLFFSMVLFVTSMVILYSELYMEHYNIKKYFFLTLFFFFSMLMLCSSNSFMNFFMGWDGLGISSLCLIMFYPNKTTMFNSYLTFFFNRLGDLSILGFLAICYFYGNTNLFLFEKFNSFLLFMVLLCTFTKGAQFPLSSWLPAAMSAPTPISAMVHSSTLVTAGIFVLWKISFFLVFHKIMIFLIFVSLTSFLVGGFLANLEVDLKKMVAFSTMSQISMITFFLSLMFLDLSLFHMFNHALFKTMIFCCCGFLFLFNSSDQNFFGVKDTNSFFGPSLVISIFGMTGYYFSSSFFTKDMVLELLLNDKLNLFFFLLIIGGIFTIFYCCQLMLSIFLPKFFFGIPYSSKKSYTWIFLIIFSLSSLVLGSFLFKTFLTSSMPTLSFLDLFLILSFMLMPLMISSMDLKSDFFLFNLDLIFSKFFSFSMFKKLVSMDHMSMHINDQMVFKPYVIFVGKKYFMNSIDMKSMTAFILFFSCVIFLL